MKTDAEWLRKLTALHPAVDNRLGPGNERYAPHKPLLLLCLLELVEQGLVDGQHLPLTAELVLRFQSFWRVVVARWTRKADLRMPFHHLGTQGFWKPLTKEREPSTHRSLTESVELDPSFLEATRQDDFRRRARALLISEYFPVLEQIALRALTGIEDREGDASASVRSAPNGRRRRWWRGIRASPPWVAAAERRAGCLNGKGERPVPCTGSRPLRGCQLVSRRAADFG